MSGKAQLGAVGSRLLNEWPIYLADVVSRSLSRKLDPSLLSYVVVIGVGLVAPRVAVGLTW